MRKTPFMLLTGVIICAVSGCERWSKAHHDYYGEIVSEEIDAASRLPGRISKILVRPGQYVKKGDPLIEFEDDILAIKKKAAQATIVAAESQQNVAEHAVRPEVKAQLNSAVAAAKKQMDFAKTSLERTRELLHEGAIAQQTVDETEMKYKSLAENYNAALAALELAGNGARKETKTTAAALVDQAKARLEEIESFEKEMTLGAPSDGEVMEVLNHEGELVPMGYPVVTLVKLADSWVTLNVRETDLKDFPMERRAEVEIPALGRQLLAQVKYIGAMANFATKTTTAERSSFDLKTFEVRLDLTDKPEGIRPGMSARVVKLF